MYTKSMTERGGYKMLTWAMAWMMVRLGEVTGYLLVLSVFGDVLLALLLVALIRAIIETMITVGAGMMAERGSNGTGPDST